MLYYWLILTCCYKQAENSVITLCTKAGIYTVFPQVYTPAFILFLNKFITTAVIRML